ncbi:MAG: arsenate reductase ArsC [Promethearchaeota archaeon]
MKARGKVVFVCKENACRSQMAEAFAGKLLPEGVEVLSAGLEAAGEVNPLAVEAMAEIGIDLSGKAPKNLDASTMDGASLVVTMGCIESCPFVPPGIPVVDWDLEDPSGRDIGFFREIRDEIGARVEELSHKLSRVKNNGKKSGLD